MSDKSRKKIIVVGGGAAGCMAAITACSEGADVTLIEKNKTVAKKILSTGNGKCNYCHDVITPADYHLEAFDDFINTVDDDGQDVRIYKNVFKQLKGLVSDKE